VEEGVDANTETDDFAPSYSPDGKKIAFSHHGVLATDYEVWMINATGGRGRVKVTDNDAHDGYPDYSPNGTKIAYTGFDGTDDEIYTINVGGGAVFKVTNNDTVDGGPSWENR
jgi:tricorn protease